MLQNKFLEEKRSAENYDYARDDYVTCEDIQKDLIPLD